MEALKPLFRFFGDLLFTVGDGIDQLLSGRGASSCAQPEGAVAPDSLDDVGALPVINPATGLQMLDGVDSMDSAGHLYGSSH